MPSFHDLIYTTAAVVASPWWLCRLCRSAKMRAVLRGKFSEPPVRESDRPAAWVHCASVGEVLLARGLVAALADARPGGDLLISYNTPTAAETAATHFPDALRFYCPADFSGRVTRALDRLKPSIIILMELELWPNLVRTAHRRGVPVAVVNGRITERSAGRYRLIRPLLRPALDAVAVFAMQSQAYAGRIIELGADPARVHVTGSMKYENVSTGEQPDAAMAAVLGIGPDQPVIVGGCTYAGEDEALIGSYLKLLGEHPGLRLILAPRHPERLDAVEAAIAGAGFECVRRSELAGAPPGTGAVLLIDTVGELEAVYSLATVAFVGGSLIPRGGHNIMEPAGRGKPVLVGPHTANFSDAVSGLEQAGGLRIVPDADALHRSLAALVAAPDRAREMGRLAREAVLRQKGALRRTLDLLIPLLEPRS